MSRLEIFTDSQPAITYSVQILYSMFKLYEARVLILIAYLVLTFTAAELEIDMQLPALQTYSEPTVTTSYDLKAQTLFTHQLSSLLAPQINNKYCWYNKGDIILQDQSLIIPDQMGEISDNFIYSQKYKLIYRLNAESLSVFRLSNKQSIEMLRQQSMPQIAQQCYPQLAVTADEEYLFVFSCDRITRLKVNKMMTSAQMLIKYPTKQKFYGRKIVRAHDLFIWLSWSQGLKIFQLTAETKLVQLFALKQYTEIADCVFHENRLYLLEAHHWVHVLEKSGKQFQQVDSVSMDNISPDLVSFRIFVNNRNLYIYSSSNHEEFITQLYYYDHKVQLIRYFKGFHNLIFIDIFRDKLLLIDQHSAEYIQINRDPRTLQHVDVGITNNHITQMFDIARLNEDTFLVMSMSALRVLQISIRYPSVSCQFPQEAAYQTFEVEVDRECQEKANQYQHIFYKQCSSAEKLVFKIGEQPNIFHYYAIALVFLFCTSMILFMIAWRKGKLEIIEQLLEDINKVRRKNQQNIQFVEEQGEVRESNWHDIRDNQDQQRGEEEGQETEYQGQKDESNDRDGNNQKHVQQILDDHNFVSTEREMMQLK